MANNPREEEALPKPADGSASIQDACGRKIPEAWKWHIRALLDLRARLLKNRGDQTEAARSAGVMDLDGAALADLASDEFDHDLALAMWSNEDELLQEIDAALQRIRDGTYGFCEETGKNITAARLRAIPWTRYTVEVAARLEEEGAKPGPHLHQLKAVAPPAAREDEMPGESENFQHP